MHATNTRTITEQHKLVTCPQFTIRGSKVLKRNFQFYHFIRRACLFGQYKLRFDNSAGDRVWWLIDRNGQIISGIFENEF